MLVMRTWLIGTCSDVLKVASTDTVRSTPSPLRYRRRVVAAAVAAIDRGEGRGYTPSRPGAISTWRR
ncbi:MAG: hypothetical protein ACREM3_01670 [Candidatus Rokuibacteriota bacterium]